MVDVKKLRTFYDFCKPRATLCGDSRGRGSKTEDFFAIFNMRVRPSAEIRLVEVQKLRTCYDFCKPRATLCGDSRGRGSKTADFLRFLTCGRDPLRNGRGSRACFRNPAVAGSIPPLVRGSSGLKIAAFKYNRSTRSVLLQPPLESRNF